MIKPGDRVRVTATSAFNTKEGYIRRDFGHGYDVVLDGLGGLFFRPHELELIDEQV